MSVPELNSPIIETASQCTDHMIIANWNITTGWADPELKPYSNFSIPPTASFLHYATQCFEGLKMYRGYDGALRLFRPDINCERLLISSRRISLPEFNPKEIVKLIIALAAFDGPKWLPRSRPGSCLYIRPCIMGSQAGLGVASPKEAILFIIATFMPPAVFPHGLRLLADDTVVRAWPGGFGYAKVGANYGPSLMATFEAKKKGFHQVLWLFDDIVTEAGASNFFVIWKHPTTSKLQLVTAPMNDQKLILDGVTRRSILQLTKERLWSPSLLLSNHRKYADAQKYFEQLEIVERNFSINELIQAIKEDRVLEAFSSGTAVSLIFS
ncbi:putative branched-chain-amino-acid aminotransferase [Erysiphe necator]|uniref:Putative branched-chain-amino-acid aminotransferase n=1 Tax=Uncinula necator TaxID=52586 RepID=A0A0B1P727_UNCNE|nr:putative branched-chain-amino-acid aminotransferase [Erysiphe necator]